MKIEYSATQLPQKFETIQECFELMAKLEKQLTVPTAVVLTNNQSESLSFILKAKFTNLVFFPKNYHGIGSYHSVAPSPAEQDLTYLFFGDYSVAPQASLIERDKLNNILTDFMVHGGRSKLIEWTED